jgi:hypothetical protein
MVREASPLLSHPLCRSPLLPLMFVPSSFCVCSIPTSGCTPRTGSSCWGRRTLPSSLPFTSLQERPAVRRSWTSTTTCVTPGLQCQLSALTHVPSYPSALDSASSLVVHVVCTERPTRTATASSSSTTPPTRSGSRSWTRTAPCWTTSS